MVHLQGEGLGAEHMTLQTCPAGGQSDSPFVSSEHRVFKVATDQTRLMSYHFVLPKWDNLRVQ